MKLQALDSIEQRYMQQIASLMGMQGQDITFNVVKGLQKNSDDNRLAQGYIGQGVVDIDRKFFRTGDRRDVRGALIHEIAHALGAQSEDQADYARYMLNPKEAAYWEPSEGVLKMANAQGGQSGPGLPGLGKHGGRMRNTFANVLSKNQVNYTNPGGAQALPALSPAQQANLSAQMQGLYAQYQADVLAAKQQRVGIRAGLMTARRDIRAERISEMAGTVNRALDEGTVGSSFDLSRRTGVVAAAQRAQAAARAEAQAGVAQTRLQEQQAGINYFMGQQQLQAGALAQQQEALAQQLQNNLIISGQESSMDIMKAIYEAMSRGVLPGGGGGGSTGGGTYSQQQALAQYVANKLAAGRM